MRRAIGETERRRARQIAFNAEHGITPRGIVKQVRDLIDGVYNDRKGRDAERAAPPDGAAAEEIAMTEQDLAREIRRLEKQMLDHARNLEFEQAARVRDQLALLKTRVLGAAGRDHAASVTPRAM
jgi:excinuclease ABC subunit B